MQDLQGQCESGLALTLVFGLWSLAFDFFTNLSDQMDTGLALEIKDQRPKTKDRLS
jgi:hypothetical protein